MPKKRYLLLFLIVAAVLFRDQLFRLCVSYEPVGRRDFIALTDAGLVRELTEWTRQNPGAGPEEMIAYARKQTAYRASFTMSSASSHPDEVLTSGRANCVGYARLFAAILDQVDTEGRCGQEVVVGEISLFGQSLHQLTNDPFWRDHDYNKVVDKVSGEVFFLDVTLYDYLWIRFIR